MHRRSFLVRCGLAAAGATFSSGLLPGVDNLRAASLLPIRPVALSDADRAVLQLLSAYSSSVSLVGGGVLTRATGLAPRDGATQVVAIVRDYPALTSFWRSDAENALGLVRVDGNNLSFSLAGAAYSVTNRDPKTAAAADAGVAGAFAHEALAYDPATNTLGDPYDVLTKQRIELTQAPAGGIKAGFQTLLQGWLESARYGLKLGRKFKAFQAELLAAVPTDKAAKKVVQALVENISPLAASFDVKSLRVLLTSPLVDASLRNVLGRSGAEVLAAVAGLRAQFPGADYPDAALWLATLLSAQIKDGSDSKWVDVLSGDPSAGAATQAALAGARRLVLGDRAAG